MHQKRKVTETKMYKTCIYNMYIEFWKRSCINKKCRKKLDSSLNGYARLF